MLQIKETEKIKRRRSHMLPTYFITQYLLKLPEMNEKWNLKM